MEWPSTRGSGLRYRRPLHCVGRIFSSFENCGRVFAPLFPLFTATRHCTRGCRPLCLTCFRFLSQQWVRFQASSWAFRGVCQAWQRCSNREEGQESADFDKPELVAESLRTAQAQYWRSYSYVLRALGSVWTRARFFSPISYDIVKKMVASSIKVVLVAVLIGIVAYGLHMIPVLLKKYATLDVRLFVPSPSPLYFSWGLVLFLNAVIAVTMFPFRRTSFTRTCESVPVMGHGDPACSSLCWKRRPSC